jgi:diguanylate cyclase (GGDEF)-like protein
MGSKSAKPRSRGVGTGGSKPPSQADVPFEERKTVTFEHVTEEIDVLPNIYAEEMEGTSTDQTAVLAPTSMRSAQRATLMVIAGSAAGKVYGIETDNFIVGRGKDSHLALADTGISRTHCAVIRDSTGKYFIKDLGSTNGTLINGVRVDRVELRAGDRFQIGAEAVLQFGFFDAAEEGLVNQLYESATRDPLTRALNRRAFQERLIAEVSYAVRHRERLVGMLLDIDRFKTVNDTHGHTAGDVVLRGVAMAIATTLRTEDVFARYGGEEFVLLGRGLTLDNGVKLAERIRSLVANTEFSVPARLKVTLSAGVAELAEMEGEPTGENLLILADRRLYDAKNGGRNRVVAK